VREKNSTGTPSFIESAATCSSLSLNRRETCAPLSSLMRALAPQSAASSITVPRYNLPAAAPLGTAPMGGMLHALLGALEGEAADAVVGARAP
jgi:hypothetical protein